MQLKHCLDVHSSLAQLSGFDTLISQILEIGKGYIFNIMEGAATQPQGPLLKPKLLKFSINGYTLALTSPREGFHGCAVTVALHAKSEGK